jgi:hypothetical protein
MMKLSNLLTALLIAVGIASCTGETKTETVTKYLVPGGQILTVEEGENGAWVTLGGPGYPDQYWFTLNVYNVDNYWIEASSDLVPGVPTFIPLYPGDKWFSLYGGTETEECTGNAHDTVPVTGILELSLSAKCHKRPTTGVDANVNLTHQTTLIFADKSTYWQSVTSGSLVELARFDVATDSEDDVTLPTLQLQVEMSNYSTGVTDNGDLSDCETINHENGVSIDTSTPEEVGGWYEQANLPAGHVVPSGAFATFSLVCRVTANYDTYLYPVIYAEEWDGDFYYYNLPIWSGSIRVE